MTRCFDIAVIGGSLGGVQAARAACSHGLNVYLCEQTRWIGGQLTSQAVPPDENRWIESQGATQSYLTYRKAVRDAYRADPAASDLLRSKDVFCPGCSWVSRVAHAPSLAHRLLSDSLAPYLASGQLVLETQVQCVEAEVRGNQVISVVTQDTSGTQTRIQAKFFLDATDTGELLPLTGTEYRIGAESREETGEPHAPETGDPQDQQPITWVAALELTEKRMPMEKPACYDDFIRRTVRGEPHLSWNAWGATGQKRFSFYDNELPDSPLGLWSYRRIQYPPYFTDHRPEISLLNWPQNDYLFGNIIDDPKRDFHLSQARELTLSVVYWLWEQGYPVRLNPEAVGTEDGLAMAPYIRESRRIVARRTVLEQEITRKDEPGLPHFDDTIGVGHYAIDIHMTTRTRTTMYAEGRPFEIPLHALIPVRMENLLPAAKNIGVTHITGGCFRLHPVEWTIGEAAGHLAAFCCEHHLLPSTAADHYLHEFQDLLIANGFQLHWNLPENQ